MQDDICVEAVRGANTSKGKGNSMGFITPPQHVSPRKNSLKKDTEHIDDFWSCMDFKEGVQQLKDM
jgi:hypothetical protein